MSKDRVLFIYTNGSSFIKGDIEILSERYFVSKYRVNNSSPLILALSLIKLSAFLLLSIYKFKIIFIWFADYHSFLPVLAGKIFGKKTVLVAGGYDVCREKKYNYGSFVNPLRGFMAIYSIKNATICLAVSENVRRIIHSIAPNSNCTVLYNGVSLSPENVKTASESSVKKEGVLCVSVVSSEQSFYIKGVDRYISAARELKNIQFTLVGADRTFIQKLIPDIPFNLTIAGKVDHSQTINYYVKSKVYCQFSRRESFCLALAESMMFHCTPVISNVGGMPEVVGDNGIITSDYSPVVLANAITSALENEENGDKCASRIEALFMYNTRKQKLLQLLDK